MLAGYMLINKSDAFYWNVKALYWYSPRGLPKICRLAPLHANAPTRRKLAVAESAGAFFSSLPPSPRRPLTRPLFLSLARASGCHRSHEIVERDAPVDVCAHVRPNPSPKLATHSLRAVKNCRPPIFFFFFRSLVATGNTRKIGNNGRGDWREVSGSFFFGMQKSLE